MISQEALNDNLASLAAEHEEVAAALERAGMPLRRHTPPGFPTLLNAIVGQQISVKAAAAIRGRLYAALADPTPECLLNLSWQDLRDAGLSARKIDYAQGLARALIEGRVCLTTLKGLDDEAATAHLTQLKGFGPWSAKIYLLFSEGRGDIYPPADLALEKGLQLMLGLPEKPVTKEAESLVLKYSPYRSALCHLLWALYGAATLD